MRGNKAKQKQNKKYECSKCHSSRKKKLVLQKSKEKTTGINPIKNKQKTADSAL